MIYDRRPKSTFQLSDIPMEACAVAAGLLVVAVLLFFLSRPSGSHQRLAALEQQATIIATANKAGGDLGVYPLGSVCSGTLDDAFKNQLSSALINTGLTVTAMDVSPAGKTGEDHPLMGYTLTLKASGTYEQAVNSLEVMAHYRPRLFLDTMSLRNQTSSVDLDVEGRLFCRWTKQG